MNVHFLQSAVIDDMNNCKRKIGGKHPKEGFGNTRTKNFITQMG